MLRSSSTTPAPVLTSPADGDHETADWTVSATADAPTVRFLADGKTLSTDTAAPFSSAVALGTLTNGSHVITAVACNPAGSLCDASNASNAATITVSHLTPTISSLSYAVFSPNGDGVREHTAVTFVLDADAGVTMRVTDSNGATVRSVSLGQLAPGSHVWNWNGADTPAT